MQHVWTRHTTVSENTLFCGQIGGLKDLPFFLKEQLNTEVYSIAEMRITVGERNGKVPFKRSVLSLS